MDYWAIGFYTKFMSNADKINFIFDEGAAEKVVTYFLFDELDNFVVTNVEKHYSHEYDCIFVFVTYIKDCLK